MLIIYYYLEPSVIIKYINYLQTFNLFFTLNLQIFDETDCTKEDYFTSFLIFKTLGVSLVKG